MKLLNSKCWRINQLTSTASTNDDVRQAAEAGEEEGLVVWALQQTAGRGRHGRTWESPEGNLYCSVLLRPDCGPQNYGHYSFMAALALYDTVQELLPKSVVTLKWPNDILAGGKKISGILLESGDGFLILGMGLNVAASPDDTLYPATSLAEEGVDKKDLAVILDRLLENLWSWYGTLKKEGFRPLRETWQEQAQKGRLSVRMPGGVIEGDYVDIDVNGSLRLRLANGTEKAIASGDVFLS